MAVPGATSRSSGIRLGTLLGAPVSVSSWWFLVAVLITVVFAPTYRSARPDLPDGAEYLMAATLVVLLYVSVLLHEIGHALAARSFGIPVLRIRLDVLGGFTEMSRSAGTPAREAVVAGAGPAVSVMLALGGIAAFVALPPGTLVSLVVGQLAAVNALVSIFNLLPGLPLDGGSLLRSAVWAATGQRGTATVFAAWSGRAVAVVTALLPLLLAAWLGGRPTLLGALWFLVLSGSIWASATAVLRQEHLRRRLPGLAVRTLMRPVVAVAADEAVAEVVSRVNAERAGGAVVVDDLGRPVALVSEAAVLATPPERQPFVPAATLARRLATHDLVDVGLVGAALLEALAGRDVAELVVVDASGRAVGLLRQADVEQALSGPRGG